MPPPVQHGRGVQHGRRSARPAPGGPGPSGSCLPPAAAPRLPRSPSSCSAAAGRVRTAACALQAARNSRQKPLYVCPDSGVRARARVRVFLRTCTRVRPDGTPTCHCCTCEFMRALTFSTGVPTRPPWPLTNPNHQAKKKRHFLLEGTQHTEHLAQTAHPAHALSESESS